MDARWITERDRVRGDMPKNKAMQENLIRVSQA